ncbi:hypothetical protein BURK1_00715 [Burkholderiales bacterium]|nr:hypothetical protein BURK1_00715 [Burkholderiales bacterium]
MTTPTPKPDAVASGAYPTPQQALEFMQKMWNPLGIPMPGFGMPGMPAAAPAGAQATPAAMPFVNPAMMFAALDPVEIERKIAELRVVENWLAMSLAMMQMSIKTMELQKASVEALRGAGTAAGGEERRPRGGSK